MNTVAKEGRTILFVSHQMQAITNLCNRAILLDRGKISHHGNTGDVVSTYLNSSTNQDSFTRLSERKDRQGLGQIKWIDTWIENDHNEKVNMIMSGEDFFITGIFEILDPVLSPRLSFAFALYNHKAEQLTDLTNICIDKIFALNGKLKTCYRVRSKIKRAPLAGGFYTYNMMLRNNNDVQDFLLGGGSFQVENGDFFGTGKTIETGQGSLLFDQEWELEPMEGQL
jgi:lipopolysaccharide transport system ATP-binding protein